MNDANAGSDDPLQAQRCLDCGAVRWPLTRHCRQCLSDRSTQFTLAGTGTVLSLAEYRRSLVPALAGEVPYTVLSVELDEGPAVIGRLAAGGGPVEIDDRVAGRVVLDSAGAVYVEFTRSPPAGTDFGTQ